MILSDILGGSLGTVLKDVIGSFKADPTVKLQMEQALAQNQMLLQEKEMALNQSLNEIAGQNIRAESSSGDKFVTRARPAWAWAGLGIIAWNYCMMPFAGIFAAHWSITVKPVDLPDAFWWTVGTVVTGYVFNRTVQEVMSMPGNSSIKLPGVQLQQNNSPEK